MVDVSELLTVAEAAAMLRRSYQTTKDYLYRGRLSGVCIGGRWFVQRSSLEAVLAERAVNGNGAKVSA